MFPPWRGITTIKTRFSSMKFELGKTYEHTSGKTIKIVGVMDSVTYGIGYVAEDLKTGELIPTGMKPEHAVNWKEIG